MRRSPPLLKQLDQDIRSEDTTTVNEVYHQSLPKIWNLGTMLYLNMVFIFTMCGWHTIPIAKHHSSPISRGFIVQVSIEVYSQHNCTVHRPCMWPQPKTIRTLDTLKNCWVLGHVKSRGLPLHKRQTKGQTPNQGLWAFLYFTRSFLSAYILKRRANDVCSPVTLS